jgi:hypothetical protein
MPAVGELSPSRIRLCRAFATAVMVGLTWAIGASAQPSEYAIKAEFIERFTRFIEWPERAFSSPSAPFVLCVIGNNPFGGYLDRLARDRKIKDRSVRLVVAARMSELTSCHLLFVAASESDRLVSIVERTRGAPVLTIGDTDGFAERGILVNFFLDGDVVRFEINVDEVRRSPLVFSSKLLKLARVVRSPKEGP